MKNNFENFPFLKEVLCKMCSMVGADFNKIDFKERYWFRKYSWTQEKEKEFSEWLFNYLKTNRKARNELMEVPLNNNRAIKNFIQMFLLSYGWTYTE